MATHRRHLHARQRAQRHAGSGGRRQRLPPLLLLQLPGKASDVAGGSNLYGRHALLPVNLLLLLLLLLLLRIVGCAGG